MAPIAASIVSIGETHPATPIPFTLTTDSGWIGEVVSVTWGVGESVKMNMNALGGGGHQLK